MIVGNVNKFGCTISWEPPVSDGGSPITSYIIELRDRTAVKWSPVQLTKADELSAIINDVIAQMIQIRWTEFFLVINSKKKTLHIQSLTE